MGFKPFKNIVKNLATPFLNNAINNVVSNFTNGVSGSQAKVAAQLLKKSPFEVADSQQEGLKRDPLAFSHVQYPIDLGQSEQGHYIIFYTYKNNFARYDNKDLAVAQKLGFTTDQGEGEVDIDNVSRLKTSGGGEIKGVKLDNSIYSKLPTHSTMSSAIALYMPPGTSVSYNNQYENEGTELSGDIMRTIGRAKSAKDTQEQISAALTGVTQGLAQYGKNIFGEAVSMVGAGDPVKVASKAFGVAINPNQEQFYVGPGFRTFSYSFDFWPRSPEELKAVEDIIFLFKYHSHPDIDFNTAGGRLFVTPSEFEIQYAHLEQGNEHLNKISRCVCTGVDVGYGPENQYSTFKPDSGGAAPVTYSLSLKFTELELMTKDKIYRGY